MNKLTVAQKLMKLVKYLLLSVIKGDGKLLHNGERYELNKGTHLILPVGFGAYELDGHCELIVSHTVEARGRLAPLLHFRFQMKPMPSYWMHIAPRYDRK